MAKRFMASIAPGTTKTAGPGMRDYGIYRYIFPIADVPVRMIDQGMYVLFGSVDYYDDGKFRDETKKIRFGEGEISDVFSNGF